MTFSKTILGVSIALGSLAAVTPALADVPTSPTAGHATASAILGYGFHDGVDFGLGLRGGYTLPMNVYLGGSFTYHFGSDDVSLYYIGVEGGYDIDVDPVIIRPYLGLGDAVAHFSGPSVCVPGAGCISSSGSEGRFAAWPGASVMYPINNFFVGGDARILIASDFTAFSLFATGGMQF